MKALGYLLITAGFLAGSVVAVQTDENHIDWAWFLPFFAVGVVGVVAARVGAQREARHETKLEGDLEALTTSISRLVENLERLSAEDNRADPYRTHARIDELLRDDLATFADARECIGHIFSLAAYAEVMNDFAAGERYVNRVWSASIDGWVDELEEYLGRAREQFTDAQTKLQALQQTRSA
jgi:hypothetical protein